MAAKGNGMGRGRNQKRMDAEAPGTSGTPSTSRRRSPKEIEKQSLPGQETKWEYGIKSDIIRKAFPEGKPEAKYFLGFFLNAITNWIEAALPDTPVPFTLASAMTDKQWQQITNGWDIKKFGAGLGGQQPSGYHMIATSKDKQKVLIRCHGNISVDELDWMVTEHAVKTFVKVHYITDEEIYEGKKRGVELPDVCVEMDPERQEPRRRRPPQKPITTMSKEEEAKIYIRSLQQVFTKQPKVLEAIVKAGKQEKERPKEEAKEPPKKAYKKEEHEHTSVMTNVRWGYCKSTIDLNWKDKLETGRYIITVLQTTVSDKKVYILEERPEGVSEEEDDDYPAWNAYPKMVEFIQETDSEDDLIDLEELTDQQKEKRYEAMVSFGEVMNVEMDGEKIKMVLTRYGTEKPNWTFKDYNANKIGPNITNYADDLVLFGNGRENKTQTPWTTLAIDERNIGAFSHWRRGFDSIYTTEGMAKITHKAPKEPATKASDERSVSTQMAQGNRRRHKHIKSQCGKK